ncbi:hypothetical protein ABQF34_30310, partial [Mycolicibacterium boenickei]
GFAVDARVTGWLGRAGGGCLDRVAVTLASLASIVCVCVWVALVFVAGFEPVVGRVAVALVVTPAVCVVSLSVTALVAGGGGGGFGQGLSE